MTAIATHHASYLRETHIPTTEDQPPPGGDAVDHTPHLTAAIAAGDTVAFAAFYEQWFDRCYDIAAGLTRRDESFCLDVVQDAMLRVIRSMQPMRAAGLERWMVRVVHTTALDALRAERRRHAREQRRAASRNAEVEQAEPLDLTDQIDWLAARLEELDAEDRALLQARFAREQTLEHTARAARLTGPAAHGRIRRILTRLRESAREILP